MSVTDNILKTIDYAIDKKTKDLINQDMSGVISGIKDDGNYYVLLQGENYVVPNGCGISFKVGDLVWVHSPNGSFDKKFIISSRSPYSKIYTNEGDGDYGKGSSINPADIITNAEIDAMFM